MRPSRIAYCFLAPFLLCTFALQWWQRAAYPALVVLSVAGSLGIASALLVLPRMRLAGAYTCALTLGIAAALLSVARTTHIQTPLTVDRYAEGKTVTIRGRIAEEPDRRPLQTKYTIAVEELTTASGTTLFPMRGRVLATDPAAWPQYTYGQRIEARGVLEIPGAIETFHYDRYLSRYDIYSVMYRASVRELPGAFDGSRILAFLFDLKAAFEGQINKLYPEPHASFMAGLLTGSRKGIPEALLEDFNRTGLTHIIAISGYNITIIIAIIGSFLFWLPLKWRFIPSVTAIILFCLFVGASAAVVRASIMGILGLIALQAGRQSEARLTMLWTVAIMLLWNPKYLWYDAGFQLSFLAVAGLVECAPLLERLCGKLPGTLGIRESIQTTMAAQVSTTPLLIILFGRLSLIAPVANLLVAPFIPLAMLFGFAGTAVSVVWFPLGQPVAYLGWACLEWIMAVTTVLAKVPGAAVEVPGIGWLAAILYYSILVMLLRWNQRFCKAPSERALTSRPPLRCGGEEGARFSLKTELPFSMAMEKGQGDEGPFRGQP